MSCRCPLSFCVITAGSDRFFEQEFVPRMKADESRYNLPTRMPITPEDRARDNIDKLLTEAGWIVQDKRATNLSAGRGVAVREFPLKSGHGEADYLLFVDGSPIGVVEAKKEGDTLTGVEIQTTKYSEGVPDHLHSPRRPLPFEYQSTGVETRFTNLLEPDASSRPVFTFHRPESLDQLLTQEESERFKPFAYEDLLKRDKVSLDIFWLKNESLEDSANLPDPDVIAAEIAEDLQAALDQFSQILLRI